MNKIHLNKPVLICLYGYPGSGKSYVARNLAETLQIVHVSGDRIRNELFEEPRYDTQENAIVSHLMNYMCEEFLKSGIGIVYDSNALRVYQRRQLRELARQHKADYFLIWLQIDTDSAYARTQNRDRRTNDDKYSEPQTHSTFEKQAAGMQNPQGEEYLVISGKHTFATQKSAILNRFYQLGIIGSGAVQNSVTKPGLINLVPYPHTGRVDMSRRNISIR